MLAAKEKKSMSEYLLSFPRSYMPSCDFPSCDGIHSPNKETEQVLKETDEGVNLESHDSLDDFWNSMGINPNAKS